MKLNKNGWYKVEATDPLLEAIDQEDMEALIHFAAKEDPDMDFLQTMGIDYIIPAFFIELANAKLEDLKEELREHPPVYTEQEESIRQWMQKELRLSVDRWKNDERKNANCDESLL